MSADTKVAAQKAEIKRLVAQLYKRTDALTQIAALDAAKDSEEGWNEWGEAECFHKAQEIARKALK
jgi:hypothetical protein